jgi:hypothetical protein
MYEDEDNDGKFPDDSPVEVRYPRSKREEQDAREQWPWLSGTIVEQCGPGEWYVCVVARELAVLADGRPATLSKPVAGDRVIRFATAAMVCAVAAFAAVVSRGSWPGVASPPRHDRICRGVSGPL